MHSRTTSTSSSSASYESADTEIYSETVDFKGICLVDEAFLPYLNEVCEWNPSLLETQRHRTSTFSGWAFTALGRVLHFLATTRGEDLTDPAGECLHLFWDEVQVFGFDLSWLEPQMAFAFDMKNYVERLRLLRKLQEEVRMTKMEITKLSLRLIDGGKYSAVEGGDGETGWEEMIEKVDTESLLGYRRVIL